MSTKNQPTINQKEAGALLLEARLGGFFYDDARFEAHVASLEFTAPSHTATVRRLARQYRAAVLKNEAAARVAVAADEAKEAARVASLTPAQRQAEADYKTAYAAFSATTSHKGRRSDMRRKLESQFGMPRGSNGKFAA